MFFKAYLDDYLDKYNSSTFFIDSSEQYHSRLVKFLIDINKIFISPFEALLIVYYILNRAINQYQDICHPSIF